MVVLLTEFYGVNLGNGGRMDAGKPVKLGPVVSMIKSKQERIKPRGHKMRKPEHSPTDPHLNLTYNNILSLIICHHFLLNLFISFLALGICWKENQSRRSQYEGFAVLGFTKQAHQHW